MVESRWAITITVRLLIRFWQRALHQHFRFGIQVRSGFVQNQDGRVLQQRAGDGDALPLAAAQLHAALADHGVVSLRHALDEFVGQRVARGFANSSSLALGRP